MINAPAMHQAVIGIGGLPVQVNTSDAQFLEILRQRYGGFIDNAAQPVFELEVEIAGSAQLPGAADPDADLTVHFENGRWILERGDFHAELEPALRRGRTRQAATPYAIDAALRVLHSLLLAHQGGLLVHASSVVRNGRAFLFAGVSGAGKTTISRLAPSDATLLTDEISYERYFAYGTPFAGELARPGENVRAPLAAIYLLGQGPQNRFTAVSQADAMRELLACVLFFAHDAELVDRVFDSVYDLVRTVPIERLTFIPDLRVWEGIQ
jgi:hypothetical protein